jgi:hypothetical protein
MNNCCICWFFHAYINEIHGSRRKIPSKNLVRQRCAEEFNSGVIGLMAYIESAQNYTALKQLGLKPEKSCQRFSLITALKKIFQVCNIKLIIDVRPQAQSIPFNVTNTAKHAVVGMRHKLLRLAGHSQGELCTTHFIRCVSGKIRKWASATRHKYLCKWSLSSFPILEINSA